MRLRTRVTLGAVLGQVRDFRSAERHLREAIKVADDLGQSLLVASAHHNLGYLAMLQRDLPRAIAEFEVAESAYIAAGANGYLPQVHADHAQALADAGLFDDAETLARRALDMLASGRQRDRDGRRAGDCRRDPPGPARSRRCSSRRRDAAGWYRKQGRDGWVAISTSLGPAGRRAGRPRRQPTSPTDLDDVADRLDAGGLGAEATRSRLVAALVRAESNATRHRRSRRLPTPADMSAADRRLTASCSPTSTPSSPNSAAIGPPHGGRSVVGSRWRCRTRPPSARSRREPTPPSTATPSPRSGRGWPSADGRPRELLARIEATRVMAARTPSLRPPADPELARLLAELRSHEMTLADPSVSDEERHDAESHHARLERDVRRRARTARGDAVGRIDLQREIDVGARRSSAIASCSPTPGSTGGCTPSRSSPAGRGCTTSALSTTSTSGSRR